MKSGDVPTFSFVFLPEEIFKHLILKYFDFRDWLKLVIVCKQWQAAAQQSQLNKQLVFRAPLKAAVACSIIAKYRVNTLVIDKPTILIRKLDRLLQASTSVTTLVLDEGSAVSIMKSPAQIHWPHITTLAIESELEQYQVPMVSTLAVLKIFPNVTKLRIAFQDQDGMNGHTYPSVRELEITTSRNDWHYFELIKKTFPALTKLYVNSAENAAALKQIGAMMNVELIYQNPHLSQRAEQFKLTALSYHEYFNGFGRTPLQQFLTSDHADLCKELFTKYSSKQYEKDLLHREPQFNFPLRCPKFRSTTYKAHVLEIKKKNVLLAMVECRYVDYWRAFIRFPKQALINQLTQAKNYLPPTYKAIESILYVLRKIEDVSLSDIINAMGSDVFKMIASLTDKDGSTLLHGYVTLDFNLEDYKHLIVFCDVNARNHKNENAATVAFNVGRLKCWRQLLDNGAEVQCELYNNGSAIPLLKSMLEESTPVSVLQRFSQQFLQTLQWFIVRVGSPEQQIFHLIFAELVRLGATPMDRGNNDPLV